MDIVCSLFNQYKTSIFQICVQFLFCLFCFLFLFFALCIMLFFLKFSVYFIYRLLDNNKLNTFHIVNQIYKCPLGVTKTY